MARFVALDLLLNGALLACGLFSRFPISIEPLLFNGHREAPPRVILAEGSSNHAEWGTASTAESLHSYA
jgi:hypothetical protein